MTSSPLETGGMSPGDMEPGKKILLALLDRDGVLNEDRGDFVKSPDELVMIPGAAAAVAALNRAGWPVAVVTNQSCIGRGLIDRDMLERIHLRLAEELAAEGGHLDALFFCPDAPWEATPRRKPGNGMLREALDRFSVSPSQAVMIGDTLRDLQAAASLGCPRILVQSGKGRKTQAEGIPREILPVSVARDLADAVAGLTGAEPTGAEPTGAEPTGAGA